MTYEEAIKMATYREHCTCGGYAYSLNGRDPKDPHMAWCPQREEFIARQKALSLGPSEDVYRRQKPAGEDN